VFCSIGVTSTAPRSRSSPTRFTVCSGHWSQLVLPAIARCASTYRSTHVAAAVAPRPKGQRRERLGRARSTPRDCAQSRTSRSDWPRSTSHFWAPANTDALRRLKPNHPSCRPFSGLICRRRPCTVTSRGELGSGSHRTATTCRAWRGILPAAPSRHRPLRLTPTRGVAAASSGEPYGRPPDRWVARLTGRRDRPSADSAEVVHARHVSVGRAGLFDWAGRWRNWTFPGAAPAARTLERSHEMSGF
jgi:hypothetical protein